MRIAVETGGHMLVLHGTQADKQDRPQVRRTAKFVQAATGRDIELADVDQGYACERAQDGSEGHGVMLRVVKLSEAKRRFVPRPRRWVVETIFACIMVARCFAMSASNARTPVVCCRPSCFQRLDRPAPAAGIRAVAHALPVAFPLLAP